MSTEEEQAALIAAIETNVNAVIPGFEFKAMITDPGNEYKLMVFFILLRFLLT